MAKSEKQKQKLLYIADYLMRRTDEQHTVSVSDIIKMLAEQGISAERKSVYSDIAALQDFGMDIIQVKSKTTGYYVGARDFELPELKLLADAVVSSRFITLKKTESLLKKIEGLCSPYQATELQRQIYVHDRVKSMNESIYLNVDSIHNAISRGRRVRFRYFRYDINKRRVLAHDGAAYEVSPFALMWGNENYYLLAYDASAGIIKHYRVDRIIQLELTELPREGEQQFAKIDLSSYADRNFSMFGGQPCGVRIRFENELAGVVIDRFGKELSLMKYDDEHFEAHISVAVSPQFFAWLWGFGGAAQIVSPPSAVEQQRAALRELTQRLL